MSAMMRSVTSRRAARAEPPLGEKRRGAPKRTASGVARDDRRHYFSTTMEEHSAAVTRYRLSRASSR